MSIKILRGIVPTVFCSTWVQKLHSKLYPQHIMHGDIVRRLDFALCTVQIILRALTLGDN